MSEPRGAAADQLEILPLTARNVLQIGEDEALAAAYRARNPRARYTVAAPGGAAPGAPFDAIVLVGGLEAHDDPEALLAQAHGMLADHGHLLLRFANVAHWRRIVDLLHGRWPGGEADGLIAGNGRGLALEPLKEMLARAGFVTVKGRTRQDAADQRWAPALAELAERMGLNRAEFLARATTRHYDILARKAGTPAPPLLHLRTAAFALQLMEARTRLPADYMGAVPDVMAGYAEKSHALPALPPATPKVLVVQRHIAANEGQWFQRLAILIRGGWIVVAEWDDHPDFIAAATRRTDNDLMWTMIAASHAVQTSTEPLAAEFRARGLEVAAFANSAFTLPPFPAERGGPARIFHGAANRERFSEPVARALAPVLARHPGTEFEVVHDRRFFDALPTTRKRFHPTLPYADYLEVMGRCDIVLTPLEGAPGERFKSDIKWVEAAARGAAVIASPAVYEGTIRDGENGLIARGLDDWAPAVARLLDDPALRRRLARQGWDEVRDTRMFADQAAARHAWYRSLWARREELQARLLERFPLLAEALARTETSSPRP